LTAPALVLPSPQSQVALWVSPVPGSLNVALVLIVAPFCCGSTGALIASTLGATLFTATSNVVWAVPPWPSSAVIVTISLAGPSVVGWLQDQVPSPLLVPVHDGGAQRHWGRCPRR
jgi:hypothetical protein